MKKLLQFKKRTRSFFIACFMLFFSIMTHSQNTPVKQSVDAVLVNSALHMPWIQRSDATDNVYKGEKFNYNLVENNKNIQKWAEQYPNEVISYKQAIEIFFKETSVNDLIGLDQDFYFDMKAQYQMVKNLLKWELTNQNN